MSDILRERIRVCLTAYSVEPPPNLDIDELAAELLDAVLPANDDDCLDEPIFRSTICGMGVCTNCYCDDCSCCIGCGQIDADIIGSHGYWCAL
ncbi:hypothetical protein [Mycobacterium sp. PSTR-4-N]|uniref:hypothetical protein n=1 Tax=Mycobacterium sp. PSTR-4-N TaxID=2917745 RepID=UPI001F14B4D1|nr:hypothetical protein [Mycobacterium sp. PSTR-4-N]MCG7596338.1 hypothetical protein [Mycobacterium sp. PSTR-4-N]